MNINRAILRSKRLHTKIMEWTNDDALELIEQYRTHTELWNRADPKYKDKLCRFRAWSEIAERFGCSKAEVERKMNVLLTQYRREKHKMLVKLYQGIQPNPSKWYAFKRFDFMEAGGGGASVTMGMGMGMGVGVGVGMGMGMGIGISGAITGGNSGNSSGIVSVMHHHHRHQSGSGGSSSGAGNSNISNNNTNNNNSTASIIVGGLGGNSLLLNSNSFVHNNNHHSVAVSGCSNITGSDSGSGSGSNTNNSSSNNLRISKNVNITPNGHHPHHHHHHHHTHLPSHPHPHAHSLAHHHHHHHNAAAVAAAAALNGLAVANYESTATAVASAMPTTTSYHRRMKSKEMKYFGAMGLNMLLANAQPALDNWNALGQYSPPPLNERSHQLHGPLTMSFAAAAQQHHQQQQQQSGIGEVVGGGTSFTTQNLFSRASSNHSEEESTQKPMDTGEIECNDEKINLSKTKCESTTPTPTPTPTPTTTPALTIATTTRTITPSIETSIAITTGAATLTTAATAAAAATATAATSIIERKILTPSNERQFERQIASTSHHTETYISSLGNDNTNNSTTPITVTGLGVPEQHTNTTSRSAILHIKNNNGSSPIPNTQIHDVHNEQQQHFQKHLLNSGHLIGTRNPNDIAIKQELLVDYFHAPHPPAPSDSQRSYSSTEDNRHLTDITDEYAQDLRVSAAAAAAAAAAKTLDFTRFVLPSGLRRSSDLLEEKFSPLNMRKLNSGASTVSSTAAGHMLMNSLLSNESTSEDNNVSISGRRKSDSIGSGQATQDAATSAAAATAAAIYAENFNKDDCDYVGSNVSVKLRTMDRTQRIIAEKLISEVLFYGQFNELERSARIQPK